MNSDGSKRKRITNNSANDSSPDWQMNAPTHRFTIPVTYIDLPGNPVKSMWTTVRTPDGTPMDYGFRPLKFIGNINIQYKVNVANYDGKIYNKWFDNGSTNKNRTITWASNTPLAAVYDTEDALRGFTSLAYAGSAEQPDLAANALTIDCNSMLHMWAIIVP